jgi:hypothetical protein
VLKDVVYARPLGGYRVRLRFEDGLEGDIDLESVIRFEGVFAPLEDPERFTELSVSPELGTVTWACGADLAPEFLYDLVVAAAKTLATSES